MRVKTNILVFLAIILLSLKEDSGIKITQKSVDGRLYNIYEPYNLKINFTLSRPDQKDSNIILCVPGTYTSPQGKPEEFIVIDGQIMQKGDKSWNGYAICGKPKGYVFISKSHEGFPITEDKLSVIQSHLLVYQKTSEHFKPQAKFQRRALATFRYHNEVAIIESEELLDLNEFATDLVNLGVKLAINLDMGAWGEGWYREGSGKINKIGQIPEEGPKQTNWIVFTK